MKRAFWRKLIVSLLNLGLSENGSFAEFFKDPACKVYSWNSQESQSSKPQRNNLSNLVTCRQRYLEFDKVISKYR